MHRIPRLMGLTMAFAILSAVAAPALEAPLQYVDYCDSPRLGGYRPSHYVSHSFSYENPQSDFVMPEDLGKGGLKPVYTTLSLGSGRFLVAIDGGTEGGDFYDRLYFDADADGNLREEKPIEAKTRQRGDKRRYATFEAIEARLPCDGKTLPYRFEFQVRTYDLSQMRTALDQEALRRAVRSYSITKCHLQATFQIDGKNYVLMLSDGDGNGLFAECGKVTTYSRSTGKRFYASGDRLYLTADRTIQSHDGLPCANTVAIGDKAYRIECPPARDKVILTPVANKASMGALTFEGLSRASANVALYDPDAKRIVSAFAADAPLSLPTGHYQILQYARLATKDGAQWVLSAYGSPDGSACDVAAGKKGALKAGTPYAPMASARTYGSRNNPQVDLSMVVRGAGGEEMRSLRLLSGKPAGIAMDGSRVRAPGYVVKDANGKTVAEGKMEYG